MKIVNILTHVII